MKNFTLLFALALLCSKGFAQDTTNNKKPDTIHIGGMTIIKKGTPSDSHRSTSITFGNHNEKNNFSTSEFIFDIGFSNWNDQTNYTSATAGNYIVNRPGSPALSSTDFKLRTGKSSNINIWFFMQRLSLIKHYVNLKYGLGIELNNYRFKSNLSFKENGSNPYLASQNINHAFVFRDSIGFYKDKLAADYVTIPFMLNFVTNPNKSSKGLSFSAGVSMGYLYSTRNKQVSSERGKHKNRGDYDLEKFKFSYIGELGLAGVRLYGSYSPNSIFENGLKMMPYTIGIRLSNW